MSDECLPIILVSAADAVAAQAIISELIDNDVTSSGGEGESADGARVWELSNKYYTARVRVCACADDAPPSPAASAPSDPVPAAAQQQQPEAHIIYLAENECSNGAALNKRAGAVARASDKDGECAVRLALCACERDNYSQQLREAARTHRYELVSLRTVPSEEESVGPFPELSGLPRAREALHAHTWPSLRLHRDPAAHMAHRPQTEEDDEFSPFQAYQNGVRRSSHSSDSDPDEEEMVRRAELLAEALGALSAARDLATSGGEDGGAERRLRAETVVAAFCRALGTDIDRL